MELANTSHVILIRLYNQTLRKETRDKKFCVLKSKRFGRNRGDNTPGNTDIKKAGSGKVNWKEYDETASNNSSCSTIKVY